MTLVEHIALLIEGTKFESQAHSPLDYDRGGGRVQRLVLSDSSSKESSTHEYFRELDPSVVGFLDFHKAPYGYYIDYMSIRPDMRRKGYARKLVEKFYAGLMPEAKKRHKAYERARAKGPLGSLLTVDWGKMMQAEIGKLMGEMKKRHPDIDTIGKAWY